MNFNKLNNIASVAFAESCATVIHYLSVRLSRFHIKLDYPILIAVSQMRYRVRLSANKKETTLLQKWLPRHKHRSAGWLLLHPVGYCNRDGIDPATPGSWRNECHRNHQSLVALWRFATCASDDTEAKSTWPCLCAHGLSFREPFTGNVHSSDATCWKCSLF